MDEGTVMGKPIVKWEVWFRTMHGLHTTREEALIWAAAEELDPMIIRAVPVAIAEDGTYEEKQ